MNLAAIVLHNVGDDMFSRYDMETSRLYHAHEFQVVADNIEAAANLLWDLTNVDDANHLRSMRPDLGQYGQQVTDYRRRRNRSLSVGDAIVFYELGGENRRFAGTMVVAPMGWTPYEGFIPGFSDGGLADYMAANDAEVSRAYLAHEQLYRERRGA